MTYFYVSFIKVIWDIKEETGKWINVSFNLGIKKSLWSLSGFDSILIIYYRTRSGENIRRKN